MSNVIRFLERRNCTATLPAEITAGGIQSLSKSWRSIVETFEKLEDYVDKLKQVVIALPDGPEKARLRLTIRTTEVQLQTAFISSIRANEAAERIEEIACIRVAGGPQSRSPRQGK